MRNRLALCLALLLAVVACAPEPAPEPEAEPAAAPMDDEAAIDAVRASYVAHYNMGHADQVAALFKEDGAAILANGGVSFGRDAIQASLETELAAGPTATITSEDVMVFGDYAASRGSYAIEIAAEDADPMMFGGNFITGFERVGDEWQIAVVMSNYNAPPPEGTPMAAPDEGEMMPDVESPTSALGASYAEHFNMGHPSVVAAMYADDAVSALADGPLLEGRAAIEASLAARADGNLQVAIHQVGNTEMGDGWNLSGGWFEFTNAGEVVQTGNWMALIGTDAEGAQKFQWVLTNANH
jgi:uncharacterized protein (TIGR02246 family)